MKELAGSQELMSVVEDIQRPSVIE
jgi:hypothetical protein